VLLRSTAPDEKPSHVRARALNAAGFCATNHAEYAIASNFHDKAAAIWRELGDTPGMVASLHGLGDTALWVGKADEARAYYEEGLELARARGTGEDEALFAFHLGQLWWPEGDVPLGEHYGQDALAIARASGSTTWTAYSYLCWPVWRTNTPICGVPECCIARRSNSGGSTTTGYAYEWRFHASRALRR